MTEKDYELIAASIAQAVHEAVHGKYTGDKTACAIVEHIEHALQGNDRAFVPKKFRAFIRKKYNEL